MPDTSDTLATLIGSRICHDLISPVGAITNGLELMELSGGMEGPELELITDSVHNAGAKIRFFRIAYGMASDQMIGRLEVVSVLNDISKGGRLVYEWMPEEAHSRADVRLVFLALQCCETAMPYGGTVVIARYDDRWVLNCETRKLNLDPDLWRAVRGDLPVDGTMPAHVQFALLPRAARELGRAVALDHDETTLTLTI